LHVINNISCFLHYFGVQIFKLNNIAFLYSHPSYDKALDLETVVEYDIQAGGSSGSRARGGLDSLPVAPAAPAPAAGLTVVSASCRSSRKRQGSPRLDGHVLAGDLVIVVHVLAGVLVCGHLTRYQEKWAG
jgi:hypothetical protein